MLNRVHPVAAAGFGSAAEVYERARPSYPADAIAWIAERTGLGPGRTVVDLGAGTGKLTRLLVSLQARVVAVEPIAAMRAELDAILPGVESLDGAAEAIPLADGSADVVTCAQAFHWFDPERALPEIHRVLAPRGFLVLIWNTRDLDDPLHGSIEELLAPHRGKLAAQREGAWRPPLEASPLFGELESRSFPYEQVLTANDLCDRVASTSFVAAMEPAEREALLDDVRAIVATRAEPFSFPYVTEVFVSARQATSSQRTPPVSQPTRQ